MTSAALFSASAYAEQPFPAPKRPRTGQLNRLVHEALDLYDFTAIADYVRDSNPDIAFPRDFNEVVHEALDIRLRGFGLSLGND
jgi:hypothetical protein